MKINGFGGGSGIRTHGGIATTPVFKTGAFNRSAIPPRPESRPGDVLLAGLQQPASMARNGRGFKSIRVRLGQGDALWADRASVGGRVYCCAGCVRSRATAQQYQHEQRSEEQVGDASQQHQGLAGATQIQVDTGGEVH
jgi:hypothetical protein